MTRTASCFAMLALTCTLAFGQQYKVLYSFAGPQAGDGANPVSSLVLDRTGNLYGTTKFGGITCYTGFGCGTVFQLTRGSDGTWTETILYSFCTRASNSICLDGALPVAALIIDAAGNLYGTTSAGGTTCQIGACTGTVFELSPPLSHGAPWTETVLYSFCSNNTDSCPEGEDPVSGLTMDAQGNLYGTTSMGGTGHDTEDIGGGTVFELLYGAGGWTESVLYNFCSVGQGKACLDGTLPMAGVTFDKVGNLYGTTEGGGDLQGRGTLYELSPGQNGWVETVRLTSKQSQALSPLGSVNIDSLGNLFSTFSIGGQYGAGGVFRLGPHGVGAQFSFNGGNGDGPTAGMLADSKRGALYGTTSGGQQSYGTVFQMTAPSQMTVLYNFCSQPNCTDGLSPLGGLIEDASGNLYGTTKLGGADNQGVVFEIVQSLPKDKVSRRAPSWHTILPSGK